MLQLTVKLVFQPALLSYTDLPGGHPHARRGLLRKQTFLLNREGNTHLHFQYVSSKGDQSHEENKWYERERPQLSENTGITLKRGELLQNPLISQSDLTRYCMQNKLPGNRNTGQVKELRN